MHTVNQLMLVPWVTAILAPWLRIHPRRDDPDTFMYRDVFPESRKPVCMPYLSI